VFFVHRKSDRTVHGAGMVSECCCLEGAGNTFWKVVRVVPPVAPIYLDRTAVQWASTIVHLTSVAEHACRDGAARDGGRLADYFQECCADRWRCWCFDDTTISVLNTGVTVPYTLQTPTRWAVASKVVPDVVRIIIV